MHINFYINCILIFNCNLSATVWNNRINQMAFAPHTVYIARPWDLGMQRKTQGLFERP